MARIQNVVWTIKALHKSLSWRRRLRMAEAVLRFSRNYLSVWQFGLPQDNPSSSCLTPGTKEVLVPRETCCATHMWERKEVAKLLNCATGPFQCGWAHPSSHGVSQPLTVWPPSMLNVWLTFSCKMEEPRDLETFFPLWIPPGLNTFQSTGGNQWPYFIITDI